jgi:NADH-quinone oxidoreductase subunit L
MEGPTPVSALIHAATMVTAGVFMIVRLHPLFELAPKVEDLAAGLGAATLLLAGLVALVQVDIKRVIAYSTMSQIGYMFLGAGLGAYGAGMFHLLTHAFFKALLFLAAGIVIHALAGEQDIRKMGGLRAILPRTWLAMLVGGLALTGIFPFAGFWSKDSILASALAEGWFGWLLLAFGLVGVFLTGLYTFRMLFIVFLGDPSPYVREHLHRPERTEPWIWMALTVGALTVLSVCGGWIQMAGIWHPLSDFLHPSAPPKVEPSVLQDWLTSIVSVGLGLLGIWTAWLVYGARRVPVPSLRPARVLLEHKFYFDEAYDLVFYRPAAFVARALRDWVEEPVVTGSLSEIADSTRAAASRVTQVQTGFLRTYVLALAGGLAVLMVVYVAVR